jgi:ribonuclease HI
MSPPMLRALKARNPFKMYIVAQEWVIGAVLLQEEDGKELLMAYVSRHLLDAETWYVFMEKLCLSLYYACCKFRHYILSSSCIVACQYDVIKHMLLKPILSERMGKWAYVLVEYYLAYEPLRSMKVQVVADFIVDHAIDVGRSVDFVQLKPWGLYFDGSVCSKGQRAGCVVVSPSGVYIDLSIRLGFACTNNQVEYESLLHGLEFLRDLGARDVDVFGDPNLIMHQNRGDSQCLDGVLNSYRDKCLDVIKLFDMFSIKHIPRKEKSWVNQLVQQALSYVVSQGVFWVASVSLVEHRYALRSKGKTVLEDSDRLWGKERPISGNTKWLLGKTKPESGRTESEPRKTELSSGKEKLVLGNTNQLPGNVDRLLGKAHPEIEPGSGKAEPRPSYGCELWEELEPILGKENSEESVIKKCESRNVGSLLDEEKMEPMKEYDSVKGGGTIRIYWRLSLLKCIRDPGKTTDKKVKRQVLKYTSIDDDLYQRTIDIVLLKCLGEKQAKVAVQEVHDRICGAHQSAYKMNWLLRRVGFYWPTMIDDYVKYQKGCEACQRFGNIQLAPTGVTNSIVKLWPFRGWGLDFIGEIHPRSSKGHRFILVATDYLTK